jgi:hypothetical protein
MYVLSGQLAAPAHLQDLTSIAQGLEFRIGNSCRVVWEIELGLGHGPDRHLYVAD